jgi:hypothetical protein
LLALAIWGCAFYVNLSFAVTQPADYRWFPPFEPNVDDNRNRLLGGEYFHIAESLVRGQGYANPFGEGTGPTAWMPPGLSAILAGLLWALDGDRDAVTLVVVFLQVGVLIGTGWMVLALARQTTRRLGVGLAAAVFLAGVLSSFRLCFQVTHDCWLVLLAVDLLIAGFCWLAPLSGPKAAAGWGLLGGLCALVNPVVGFAWGMSSLVAGFRQRAWSSLALAVLVAGTTVAPWTVRNYRVLGRLVPVKSNLAYELYQSQCLQPGGLLRRTTMASHPAEGDGPERREYKALGEVAFLEQKGEQFRQAVRSNPLDYLHRTACRFLATTLWYEPFDPVQEARHPGRLWLRRLTHPVPFLALLVLLAAGLGSPLGRPQWIVIGVYLVYLLPYIGISYYERYALPLLGAKALLVIWAADRLLAPLLPARRPHPP